MADLGTLAHVKAGAGDTVARQPCHSSHPLLRAGDTGSPLVSSHFQHSPSLFLSWPSKCPRGDHRFLLGNRRWDLPLHDATLVGSCGTSRSPRCCHCGHLFFPPLPSSGDISTNFPHLARPAFTCPAPAEELHAHRVPACRNTRSPHGEARGAAQVSEVGACPGHTGSSQAGASRVVPPAQPLSWGQASAAQGSAVSPLHA